MFGSEKIKKNYVEKEIRLRESKSIVLSQILSTTIDLIVAIFFF